MREVHRGVEGQGDGGEGGHEEDAARIQGVGSGPEQGQETELEGLRDEEEAPRGRSLARERRVLNTPSA